MLQDGLSHFLSLQVQQFVSNVKLSGSLSKALSLQVEAFWQAYSSVILGIAGCGGAYVVW